MGWRAAARGLVDLVAPRLCPGCDHPLEWGELGFCGACAPLLERLPSGPALYGYGGPLAQGLRKLKYDGRTDLVEPLSALLLEASPAHAGRVDVVVPVPLHPSRQRRRGYNQTALVAEPLARALGAPFAERALRRIRPSPPQASLPENQRATNVLGAFVADAAVLRRHCASPGPRVLLVDDVRTTGATLQAASGALYRAHATSVRILALAAVV